MTHPSKQFCQIVAILLLMQLSLCCSVCKQCASCGPDVMADTNLDAIDNLLQNKIQNLGYPSGIKRTANASAIRYDIVYSNGLIIALSLELASL